jgi:predicted nuclease of predicted toxin-antitoxin system
MKLLIDVNVGGSVTEWLINSGHDVVEVRDIDCKMTDKTILDRAVKENRIIITTDNDFEKMIWQQQKAHRGVLRLENLPRSERMELIKDVFIHHEKDLLSGYIVIENKTNIV